ncbi:MAG: U32 family peptidase, partial [Nitrospirota bacterium]
MKISLGPIPYLWGPETQLKFYREVAKSPIDDIFLGEVICSRRSGLHKTVHSDIVSLLEDSGKKVYLSSLGLITNDIELESQKEMIKSGY